MAKSKTFDLTGDIRFKNTNTKEAVPVHEAGDINADAGSQQGYTMLNADDIQPSPFNEGLSQENIEEYARSMKETGLIEPIAVYDLGNGRYEILSGHQRYEAWCKILGNKTIRAVVIPYEKDAVKRFKAHTEANVLTRNKDLKFWLTRIRHAKQVLHETGFMGSKAEELKKISEMLNGISQAQLYRYESFEKLIPELQDFESKRCMSANTLYYAVGLDEEQQMEVAERVRSLQKVKAESNPSMVDDTEVTREEFSGIVKAVRRGEKTEISQRKKSTYTERVEKSFTSFMKTLSRSRTQDERREALKCIERFEAQLEEMKKELS